MKLLRPSNIFILVESGRLTILLGIIWVGLSFGFLFGTPLIINHEAKTFDETVGIDGIVLSKADVDEKGGAAISVSYVTGKPIMFLGTGQKYDDLEVFDSAKLMTSLGI